MAEKPKLYYFNGRGRMESVRWLLAACDVEFEEEFIESRDQYEKLLHEGALLYQQLPMVEIDGMKLVQTRAIQSYIAAKYDLYGNDLLERVLIDMYVEGSDDVMSLIIPLTFVTPEEKKKLVELLTQKVRSRYYPVFEKVLKDHDEDFLVGNKCSWADVHLLEAILMVEELNAVVLNEFPVLKAYKEKMSKYPTIEKFLQPGSQRKPPPDAVYRDVVKAVLRF